MFDSEKEGPAMQAAIQDVLYDAVDETQLVAVLARMVQHALANGDLESTHEQNGHETVDAAATPDKDVHASPEVVPH